jgi:hypothetical protein
MNILTWATHESYQSCMAHTGHMYFLWQGDGFKTWNQTFRPLPSNHTLLEPRKGQGQLPPDVVFDLVLSQNRLGQPHSQFQIADGVARSLHVPHVALEHTLPHPQWTVGQVRQIRDLVADANVFISEYSRAAWGWHESEASVVHHGIDTSTFSPPEPGVVRRPILLSVVNKWIERNWCCGFDFWREVADGLPCFVVGDTPGLSRPAAGVDELVWRYRTSQVFVNTSTVSPIPTSLLEAMSCGCAIVSTDSGAISEIINDGVNGYRTNDKRRFRSVLERLLADPGECRRMGDAARDTVVARFSLGRFVADWNRVLGSVAEIQPGVERLHRAR